MIVVVNWNSGNLLTDCLSSIRNFTDLPIIVVDNASTDDSAQIACEFSNVRLIKSEENIGFAAACNLGAKYIDNEFLIFLNPDAAIYSDTLQKSLAFMSDPKNFQYGVCGVKLVDNNGIVQRGCARFRTPFSFFWNAIGFTRVFPRLGYAMTEWDHCQSRDVDHVIGAFYLIRKSLFDELNGFDERYFVYLEDLDLSLRVSRKGYKVFYLADAVAFHLGGGSSRNFKNRRIFYAARSSILYADKFFSRSGLYLVLFSLLIIEPITRSVLSLSRLSWSTFVETWSGYRMLWNWLPKWVFKGVTR